MTASGFAGDVCAPEVSPPRYCYVHRRQEKSANPFDGDNVAHF